MINESTHHRKIAALLKRHLRTQARGKQLFQLSGDLFDQVIELGALPNQPIKLRGARLSDDRKSFVFEPGATVTVVIKDKLRDEETGQSRNAGFTHARFARYAVEAVREAKPTPRAKRGLEGRACARPEPNESQPAQAAEVGA